MEEFNEMNITELQPGTTLNNGKYTIEKKIGEGGFGITYKAVQNGLGRIVCIKEYFPSGKCVRDTRMMTVHLQGMSEDMFEKYRQAFVREAKTLAALHHPNIVEVIDVFDENNTSYMVMPFIEGRSLQSIVEKNGRLSYPEAVNYIAQVTTAVGYIHERHILHRDIKPDNIMITSDYKAILIDFGSAREFQQDKTQAQTSMLTHGYAPTEQYTTNSRKGSYTDIYAIGATLYFVLTGQVPLEAAARMTEKMPEPKELNPDIPEEANRTIMKAMQIKAENRHQTVQEFMDDLRNIKPSELVDETIGGTTVVVENWKKWIWWVVGGAVLIIAALVIWLVTRPKEIITEETIVTVDTRKSYSSTEDFTGMNIYPMVKVVGGTFTMGSNEIGEDDCSPHTVTLSDFYIGVCEVSQGFWKKIMGSNPSEYQPTKLPDGIPYTQEQRDSFPVENVSFDDVQEFIRKLNSRTGQKFSLPTEAQWEYAARGGQKGKDSGHKFASVDRSPEGIWYNKNTTRRVGSSTVTNQLGLYHMSGNVAEWCEDFYDEDFYRNSDGRKDPVNLSSGSNHVIRGGSFSDENLNEVSVYYRNYVKLPENYIGFRLVINE